MAYLNHGVAKDNWDKKERREKLRKAVKSNFDGYIKNGYSKLYDDEIPEVVEKLASLFQKNNK